MVEWNSFGEIPFSVKFVVGPHLPIVQYSNEQNESAFLEPLDTATGQVDSVVVAQSLAGSIHCIELISSILHKGVDNIIPSNVAVNDVLNWLLLTNRLMMVNTSVIS